MHFWVAAIFKLRIYSGLGYYKIETVQSFGLGHLETQFSSSVQVPLFIKGILWKEKKKNTIFFVPLTALKVNDLAYNQLMSSNWK